MIRGDKDNRMAILTMLMVLVAALIFGLLMAGCGAVSESAKPDIHLTFDIHEDGSNTCVLEIAAHPFVDTFIHRGLEMLERWLVEVPVQISLESQEREREGRKYAALVAQFNSLGDLNAFMNTPQLLSGLLSLLATEVTVPPLFVHFEVWHDLDAPRKVYGIRAMIDEETAEALSFVNFTIHVILPYAAEQHNATQVDGKELSWRVQPGQALSIEATAIEPAIPLSLPEVTGDNRIMLWILVGLGCIVVVALVIYLAYRLAGRNAR